MIVSCLSDIGVPSLLIVSCSVAVLLSSFSSFRLINMLLSISISILLSLYGVFPSLDSCSIILSFVIGAFKAFSTMLPVISMVFVLSVIESVALVPINALNDMFTSIFFSCILFNSSLS